MDMMEQKRTSILRVDAGAGDATDSVSSQALTDLNNTLLHKEVDCLIQITNENVQKSTCPRFWDYMLCWPPTPVNTVAELPCFPELNGINYDTSKNATKWCFPNGTWNVYTNFEGCIVNQSVLDQPELPVDYDVNSIIYFMGYTLSFTALVFAVFIFIYFKDLRCLRNTIHTNLMITYIMVAFLWIFNALVQAYYHTDTTMCAILMIVLYYFYLTNFTWMLVEGLYLYMLVVMTFTRENLRLHTYMVIGWGIPLIDVIVWGIGKAMVDLGPQISEHKELLSLQSCPWMTPHYIDHIYQAPIFIALGLNLIFLIQIMWVLITKLRSATNLETQQYRKLFKALLVLFPLLGFTYIMSIVLPMTNIYQHTRTLLLSTQGLSVAMFYCFMNSEVQTTLRHHFYQWKDARDIASSASVSRRYSMSKDSSSPNSKKESIRLQNTKKSSFFKRSRQMSMSEATTVTLVGNNSVGGTTTCSKTMNGDDPLREPLNPSENSV